MRTQVVIIGAGPAGLLLGQLLMARGISRDGLIHEGIEIGFAGGRHHIDFAELVGQSVIGYGQAELTKDLMDARAAAEGQTLYEISDVSLHDIDVVKPTVQHRNYGVARQIE